MACCWERLRLYGVLLDTEVELRDVKWWEHHDGIVDLGYYEGRGLYESRIRQAAFMGGRPAFVGPNPSIEQVRTRGVFRSPRQDMWEAVSSALSARLFHGPFLKREAVFSNAGLAKPDFMRTVKTSTAGGTIDVLFVLVPGLFYEPVHVGNDRLGGDAQASEFPGFGQFGMGIWQDEEGASSLEQLWRDGLRQAEILDAWAARQNQKVMDNPSTTGYASWRTETAEIFWQDIAAFGGHYGSTSNFYRAFGGQRLSLELDVTRPPHHHFRRSASDVMYA